MSFPVPPYRSEFVGLLAGIALALPMIGPIAGWPALTFALPTAAAGFGLGLWRLRYGIHPRPLAIVTTVLACLYALAVFASANAAQVALLTDPASWLSRRDEYVEAKLLHFALYTIPYVALAAVVSLLPVQRSLQRGLLWAFLVIATIVAIRILGEADVLVRYPYEEVRPYFADDLGRGYSLVSYGILLTWGAAASLALRSFWPVAAMFLFLAFWTNRRVETLAIVLMIFLYHGLVAAFYRERRTFSWALRPAIILGCAAGAAILLHNEANLNYWRAFLGESASFRAELLTATFDTTTGSSVEADSVESGQEVRNRWLGQGLGAYALLDMPLDYPHNLFVETYYESGLVAFLPLAVAAICAFGAAGHAILVRKCATGPWLACAASAAAMGLVVLKAGDATNAGRLLLLMTVMAAMSRSQGGLGSSLATCSTSPTSLPRRQALLGIRKGLDSSRSASGGGPLG